MLTFDKIRELERNERDTKKLQKLPNDLIEQLKEYLRRKESIKDKTSSEILELENVKRTIKRFFEYREKKLAEMALECVRTGSLPENLSRQEEKTFYQIVDMLKDHRQNFFEELGKEPEEGKEIVKGKEKIEKKEPEKKEEIKERPKPVTTVEKPKQYVYKIKKSIPAFVGPDMKTYEFRENETIELDALPKPLNDLLLKEGVIEKIET